MNGSASPDPPTTEAGDSGRDEIAVANVNGHHSPIPDGNTIAARVKSSPPAQPQDGSEQSTGEDGARVRGLGGAANGDIEGGDSEAETLIESPVKKEAEKQAGAQKADRPPKHRIGSLPVPTDNDDENDSAAVSPAPSSTPISVDKTASTEDVKDEDDMDEDADSDREDDSDALSSPGSHTSNLPSRASPVSRAVSERPDRPLEGADSLNPRKRKHRASSVSLPNKRPSIDTPKRRLRGLHSEGFPGRYGESLSPKLRAHRRTASTQSGFADGGEASSRKRRAATQGPGKESKMARGSWEESDGSSEATSHGQPENRRLQRGVGRSTSTPGRPPGREHKRHVNKYGFTKLAEACETADMDQVKEWIRKDPEQMELAEFAGNKPLQIAALNGNVEVVDYLIKQGCKIDCANVDKDTPLIDAAENGHLDVVNSLLSAGVDPLSQNLKGQQALDVVTDEVDDADDIRAALRKAIEEWNSTGAKQKREEEEVSRYRGGPSKELHFMARTYENLLKLVQNNDRNGVREFLDARVPVDNNVIAAAAKTGDSYLVNMLLVELPEKKRLQKPEKPLLSVLGTSHFEMVKSLTELDNFNPLYRNRSGKSWPELAEEKSGPNWRQEKELLQRLYDQRAAMKERRSSSPVTKRDSVKRRLISRPMEDETDEEEAPRRKNGRKLMSRKEMRARGQANSDGSSEDSASEGPPGGELVEGSTMKPPESPALRRTPTRARTKSLSAQPPESSPRTRRRSSSLRGQADPSLPTVEEKLEDKESAREKRIADEAEEARRLEVKREAEAEAKATAKRAAEEDERRAEMERRAEDERKAELARQAELEQRRKEEEAKRAHREHLVSSLPRCVSCALSASSDIDSKKVSDDLLFHFTPLQVLVMEAGVDWVANVQAAPLLGSQGIELLLQADAPGYNGSLADKWETKEVHAYDVPIVHSILTSLPQGPQTGTVPLNEDGKSILSFDEEMALTASRLHQAAAVKDALSSGEAVLRYVRLDDVLKNLRASLNGRQVRVKFDHLALPAKGKGQKEELSFFEAMASSSHRRPLPRTYVDGQEVAVGRPTDHHVGTTAVRMVHEK